MCRLNMEVSLNFQTPFQFDAFELLQADRTEFRGLHTQVAEPEQPIVIVGVHFTMSQVALPTGLKKLTTGA
jgi:hypothetical protein